MNFYQAPYSTALLRGWLCNLYLSLTSVNPLTCTTRTQFLNSSKTAASILHTECMHSEMDTCIQNQDIPNLSGCYAIVMHGHPRGLLSSQMQCSTCFALLQSSMHNNTNVDFFSSVYLQTYLGPWFPLQSAFSPCPPMLH